MYFANETYFLSCEAQRYSTQKSNFEVKVITDQGNVRSILKKETNSSQYIYQPKMEDARIQCQISLGEIENKNPKAKG